MEVPSPAQGEGLGEEALLERGRRRQRLLDAAEDPLEDPRHRDQDGRADLDQVVGQVGDGAGVGDAAARHQGQVVADAALQHVGERQEGEQAVVGVHPHRREAGPDVGQDVAVGQHHPLGPAGGAGGVDQGGEVVGAGGGGRQARPGVR